MSALITGMGAVAAVGDDVPAIFDALCAGRSGVGPLRGFDPTRFRAQHAYEIDDRPPSGEDLTLRATRWLEQAVQQALTDAGLDDDLSDVPVLIGTTLRELRSVELCWRDDVPFDLRDLHFGTALRRRFGATRTYTVANACSASLYALGLAADMIDLGEADTVVVAGVDTITESTYGMLDRVYPLPPEAVRPFDRDRRGMLQGDGAVAVVLRREADGPGGGQRHARVRGVGLNCDAYHPSAPDAESIATVIADAHRRAGTKPAEIDLVMLHGTGTPRNDEAEAEALRSVFADDVRSCRMTAIKSMTGHTAGASGLHSLVVAVRAMRESRIPPVVGLVRPIEEVAGFGLVADRELRAPVRTAQVHSFGFGGLNAVAIVEKVS
ncbi:beta-ketoacyl-[acyl-carrier-protein] synthase family protein [Micromonospora sp. WMMA1947]|uniref:beta-ketoacyl-[acyl-carrier-protein] synthase family protein n=1 Tax=Micromonospora sp. WMMA1947 TaxID=3015163 RepID=UPI00248C7DC9|nr:beta-ketoacyl-[acyl-carrier-protein] synthase family protein [Micromonospora sp. WMMA1947]WBC07487.1 beta-ketoacyl-[acyl-carrier-protein] synthase family protein [Micromonospora sp. WMMA1947]